MEAVGDMAVIRRTALGAFGERPGTIARDNFTAE